MSRKGLRYENTTHLQVLRHQMTDLKPEGSEKKKIETLAVIIALLVSSFHKSPTVCIDMYCN